MCPARCEVRRRTVLSVIIIVGPSALEKQIKHSSRASEAYMTPLNVPSRWKRERNSYTWQVAMSGAWKTNRKRLINAIRTPKADISGNESFPPTIWCACVTQCRVGLSDKLRQFFFINRATKLFHSWKMLNANGKTTTTTTNCSREQFFFSYLNPHPDVQLYAIAIAKQKQAQPARLWLTYRHRKQIKINKNWHRFEEWKNFFVVADAPGTVAIDRRPIKSRYTEISIRLRGINFHSKWLSSHYTTAQLTAAEEKKQRSLSRGLCSLKLM